MLGETALEVSYLMPLLLAVFTAVAGLGAYAWNKAIDRKHALIEIRRITYRDFIVSIAEVAHSGNAAAQVQNYQKKLAELHLIASDEVIVACAEFTALYRAERDPGANLRAEKYSHLQMAMRRDCFERTKITAKRLQEMLPFNFN
jgi:hypothetical protein